MRPQTAKILKDLVQQRQPQTVLEIGTAWGYSTLIFLLFSNATVNTIDISSSAQEQARANIVDCEVETKRVNFFCGDSAEIIPLVGGKYDFILLDGAKSQYSALLPYLIDLLSKDGILFADNVLFMGLTKRADSLPNNHKHITIARNMAKFLKEITSQTELDTTILDVEDGVSISRLKT